MSDNVNAYRYGGEHCELWEDYAEERYENGAVALPLSAEHNKVDISEHFGDDGHSLFEPVSADSMDNFDPPVAYNANEVPALAAFKNSQELQSVLGAVVELRRQFHAEPVKQKQPFPGLRGSGWAGRRNEYDPNSPGPAYDFMRREYGKEIDEGRLGPSELLKIDSLLYQTVADEAEAQGKSASAYLKAGTRHEIHYRRRQAMASVMGTTLEGISRGDGPKFFTAIKDRSTDSYQGR